MHHLLSPSRFHQDAGERQPMGHVTGQNAFPPKGRIALPVKVVDHSGQFCFTHCHVISSGCLAVRQRRRLLCHWRWRYTSVTLKPLSPNSVNDHVSMNKNPNVSWWTCEAAMRSVRTSKQEEVYSGENMIDGLVHLNFGSLIKKAAATMGLCKDSYHAAAPYFISNFKLIGNKKAQREAP